MHLTGDELEERVVNVRNVRGYNSSQFLLRRKAMTGTWTPVAHRPTGLTLRMRLLTLL